VELGISCPAGNVELFNVKLLSCWIALISAFCPSPKGEGYPIGIWKRMQDNS
jgi:hypothetical protein